VAPVMEKRNGKKPALRVSLVGQNPEFRAEVRQVLMALSEPPLEIVETTPQPLPAAPDAKPADVAMVLFNGTEDPSLAFLQYQSAQKPRPVLFALLKERSPLLMKRVLRAGADELLSLPLDSADATSALLKLSEARDRTARREGGRVCSLVSVVGGVGTTTIAANLGLALRYGMSKRVALIDLDLQSGALAVSLNLEPEVTVMPLTRLEKKLDSIQLEAALTKHPSGIYLLAAPKRIEESEMVSQAAVASIIDMMRDMFDYVVIDCGSHVAENVVAAWDRSDYLFYVLNQSVTSVRCAWRFIDLFERLGLAQVEPRYLLNRFAVNHPITERQVQHTLGRTVFAKIPRDEKSLERAELSGKDLWQAAAGSPMVKALDELAHQMAPAENAVEPAEAGLVSRIFSALGAH
jgi:pilus assembly protein CpaE